MIRRICPFILIATAAWSADAPFHRGVNLTNWMQTSSARRIQFTKFTRKDFSNIKNLGCDVIRLPINLHGMTGGAPNYTIDPLYLRFLDQAVDWAEELSLHLILDNHTFDPSDSTDPNIGDALVPVWTQMAGHFKNRSSFVYYEILNEPHGIADAIWNAIQQKCIETIRAIDKKHKIIVGPAGWNSYYNLRTMPNYADDNLIYTFHFYDPFLFTHQGAGWANPSLVPLAGVPFPYDPARMPACPPELKGTWVEGSLSSGYRTDGTVKRIRESIDIAVEFRTQRNIPLFCGEFGVYMKNSPGDDRVRWYEAVRHYLEEKDIAWTIWDYTGGFGLFKRGSDEMFDYDLNITLLEALGLNVPEQKIFVRRPDSTDFDLYRDYIGSGLSESSWIGSGTLDFYSETGPAKGDYCIYWTGSEQYCNMGLAFKPIRDLSMLVKKGYVLDFWARCVSPEARFDVRFIDTKTADATDHPWRMRVTIDKSKVLWNGSWNHLQIPLSAFAEHGSWDNGWFAPQGKFDWTAVDRFEIVSEHHAFKGIQFWFDDVRIVNPLTDALKDGPAAFPNKPALKQNYPNPFNPSTTIPYCVSVPGKVDLEVMDLTGREVAFFVRDHQTPGCYEVRWNPKGLGSGTYLCRLRSGAHEDVRKLILLK